MKTHVAINGFGRIGRTFFRTWIKYVYNCKVMRMEPKVIITAVNNLMRSGESMEDYLHLLEYDSVHGQFDKDIKNLSDGFEVMGYKIKFYNLADPTQIPWQETDVEIVVDSTGVFKDKAGLSKHMHGSVKKVVMTAPGDNLDLTVVMGVNEDQYDSNIHHIVSNASCTTNCLAPVAKVIDDAFGIEKGEVTTVHSYTADQRLVDSNHDDPRRSRAAALSMIPTKTGAAKAVGLVLPNLKGKLDGMAIRVPTPNVSVITAVFMVKKPTTKEEVNELLEKISAKEMLGVLSVCKKELVSVDFNGNSFSSIVDSKYTNVIEGNMVKILSWYDNEYGYSNRVLDLVKKMAEEL